METATPKPDPQWTNSTESMLERIKEVFDRSCSHILKVSRVGKLKLELTRLQRKKASLYQDLGARTHTLMKEGHFDPTVLNELMTRIERVSSQLDQFRSEIEDMVNPRAPQVQNHQA